MRNKLIWTFAAFAGMTGPMIYDQENPRLGVTLGFYTSKPLMFAAEITDAIRARSNGTEPNENAGNYKYFLGKNNVVMRQELTSYALEAMRNPTRDYLDFLKAHPEYNNAIPEDLSAGLAFVEELSLKP